jgi:hypothetical protein
LDPRVIIGGGIGAVVAIVLLFTVVLGGGSDKPSKPNTIGSTPATTASSSSTTKSTSTASTGPVDRGNVVVSVLNGTTVPGLAAQVADEIQRGGFKRGAVTNAGTQQEATTTVLYAPGQKAAAQEVASLIKIKKVQPLDANTQVVAGPDAAVVVTVGADRTQ